MPAKRAKATRQPRQPRYDPATLRLLLETALAQGGHPATQELVFAKPRRWRFDYSFPAERLAVELEGGIWGGGRHVSPTGFLADIEKYNAATLRGWRLLRITYDMIADGSALALIERALGSPHIPQTEEARHERRSHSRYPKKQASANTDTDHHSHARQAQAIPKAAPSTTQP